MSRAGKSGDAYATEKKFEERYDHEEELGTPSRLVEWIGAIMAGEQNFSPCKDSSWQGIKEWLKDGSILCRALNKLRGAKGLSPVKFKPNAKVAFQAMNNLENFNHGAQEYGVPASALFQTVDLVEGRKAPMLNVINCLNQLGFVANQNGYEVKYNPPAPPAADY